MGYATVHNKRVVSIASAFGASTAETIIPAVAGMSIVVTDWSLTVSGAVAALALRFGVDANEYISLIPIPASVPAAPWVVTGVRFVGNPGDGLQVVGGATSSILDGHISFSYVAQGSDFA